MTTMKQVKEAVVAVADTVGRTKDGCIMIRRGFFYRFSRTAGDFAKMVEFDLRKAGIKFETVDFGEKWTAFRGGSTVAQGSHWWVKVKVL